MTSGQGFDTLKIGDGNLANLTITGSVKVATGNGGSNTTLNPTTAGTIAGGFSVASADAGGTVAVKRITVTGATKISLGGGNDTVAIDNSIMNALTISTGTGQT